MRKWDYCKIYKKCIDCPKATLIKGDKYDTYLICDFHLQAVKDEIERVLKEKKNDI